MPPCFSWRMRESSFCQKEKVKNKEYNRFSIGNTTVLIRFDRLSPIYAVVASTARLGPVRRNHLFK